jgi:hypothetical protein
MALIQEMLSVWREISNMNFALWKMEGELTIDVTWEAQ